MGGGASLSSLTTKGFGGTLRARWLAGHTRGFVTPVTARAGAPRRSAVSGRLPRLNATPTIAAGLNISDRPITLDALLAASPNAPPSRSMIGLPHGAANLSRTASPGCAGLDGGRVAAYAAKAAGGITAGADDDLGLFAADGTPTPHLAAVMANMAAVEIGPYQPNRALIDAGIADAFRSDRNAPR